MKKETESWINKAKEDITAGSLLFDAGLPDSACYHCHQASEKFLKALLEEFGEQIPRTHDLDLLVVRLSSHVHTPDDVRIAATFLAGFGVAVRYPGTDTDLDDAREAIRMAEGIKDWANSILESTHT